MIIALAIAAVSTSLPQPASAQQQEYVWWRGVSLAGAEFGADQRWINEPASDDTKYTYPEQWEINYFAGKGMNVLRLPIRWERIQPTLNGPLNQAELAKINTFVTGATSKQMKVIIDIHNYAAYMSGSTNLLGDSNFPAAPFVDLWRRLAVEFGSRSDDVIFSLMNEPIYIDMDDYVTAVNAAIAAVRSEQAANLVLVSGLKYSGMSSWLEEWGAPFEGPANAVGLLNIVDPYNWMMIDVHQYLDDDPTSPYGRFSGTGDVCVPASTAVAQTKIAEFVQWLRQHNLKAFLSEVNIPTPDNPSSAAAINCRQAIVNFLDYVEANGDVFRGWTWWAAGPWWWPSKTMEPTPVGCSGTGCHYVACTTNCQDSYEMDVVEHYFAPPSSGWKSTNPGGGGVMNSPIITGEGNWVVGTDLGGARLSTDDGVTWSTIGAQSGLAATHVSAIAATSGGNLIIGTDGGIFTGSTDGTGFNSTYPSGYVAAIAISATANTVYAVVHPQWNGLDPVLLRSTNGGGSWAVVTSNLPANLRVTGLRTHPTATNTLWVISGKGRFNEGPKQAFLSTDSGQTFTRRDPAQGDLQDVAYSMSSTTPNLMYATSVSGTAGSVFKSTNGGTSWTKISTASVAPSGIILADQATPSHVRIIDLDQRGGKDAFLWESTNAGTNWVKTTLAVTGGWSRSDEDWGMGYSPEGLAQTLGYRSDSPNAVLWTNGQFVYKSADGGKTWSDTVSNETSRAWASRGIDNVVPLVVAPSAADANLVYAGYADLGLWRSDDAGGTWKPLNPLSYTNNWGGKGGNTLSVIADPVRPDVVWAQMAGDLEDCGTPCTQPLSLVKSTNRGVTWSPVTAGLPSPLRRFSGLSLATESASSARWLTATANGDVYLSKNDGVTWGQVVDCPNNDCFKTLHVPGNGIVALSPSGIWRSWQGGVVGSWAQIALPAAMTSGWTPGQHWYFDSWTYSGPTDVATYNHVLWVSVEGDGKGLYRSADYGQSWTRVREEDHAMAVAVDPTDGSVFLGSSAAVQAGGDTSVSNGVYRSADGVGNWSALNSGLAMPFATSIAISAAGKRWVTSPGQGVMNWR